MLSAARRVGTILPRHGALSARAMSSSAPKVPLLINGKFVESKSDVWYDVHNPATNEVVARVPEALPEEREAAVKAAADAYLSWRDVPVQRRARIMFKLQQLVESNMGELASIITREQGKTLADAEGDVFRGLEQIEHACSAATLTMGETSENLASFTDTYSYRQPLGVCAGITPFNFPAMIPMWMFPLANACGNTYVLKPSERVPGASIRLAELAMEAGLPKGVLNITHGAHDAVNFLLDDKSIKAVSFVGGNEAGRHIFFRGTKHGKRVQSNMGAKNHATVLPDSDKDTVVNTLVGAGFGAAGQRCMALSMVVFVGETKEWIHEIAEKARALKVSAGHEKGADLGPMISPKAVQRAESLIQAGIDHGAECLLDGRGLKVPEYPNGNFLGPTVLMNVNPGSPAYDEEIFGPVLCATAVDTLEDAIKLTNSNPYGNGCAIFTQSGAAARHFQREIEVTQIGINLPIPVPLPHFSFTGGKASFIGDINFYGKDGARFFTQTRTITSNWKPAAPGSVAAATLVMPTLG